MRGITDVDRARVDLVDLGVHEALVSAGRGRVGVDVAESDEHDVLPLLENRCFASEEDGNDRHVDGFGEHAESEVTDALTARGRHALGDRHDLPVSAGILRVAERDLAARCLRIDAVRRKADDGRADERARAVAADAAAEILGVVACRGPRARRRLLPADDR